MAKGPSHRRLILASALMATLAYGSGLYWIHISLHDYGHMPVWLSVPATIALAMYVAAYAVLAVAICAWLKPAAKSPFTPFLIAAVAMLAEWLRGHLFTGFPWLALGYLAVDTPLAGFAPLIGGYGVGFIAVLIAVWLYQAIRFKHWGPFVASVLVMGVGFISSQQDYTEVHGRPLRIALVQGAIPQSMKFDPQREADAITTQIGLARTAAVPGGAQLIVFPETALVRPWDLTPADVRELFWRLTQPAGSTVMLGLPMRDADGYRNSVIAMDETTTPGEFRARYDKHHLVPFGEFIPFGFRWFVDMMQMPLGDFQRGAAAQKPIAVQDQRIAVNICFEDLFGEEIIRPMQAYAGSIDAPSIMLNVSNLAWFGNTIALSQHLAISRMRSMETGKPMIRTTNTGATAVIDHRGRVLQQLPYGEPGLLATQVQGMQGETPFVRWGNLPVLIFSLILIAAGVVRRIFR